MNILDLQDKLKNFSQDQLIREMQMPTGQLPQFLLLNEITRRKKMQDSFAQQQDQAQQQTTVAQDAINSAGIPQGAAQQLAGTMAPQTDMTGNTGAAPQQMMPQAPQPVQGMAGGGIVALQDGGRVTAPRLVVRGGRQFAEMPDGSLVPMSELGYDQETSTDAAAAPRGFPMDLGPTATQADLDQRYNESRLGIDSMRAGMGAPSIGDVPAIALDTAPAAPRQAPMLDFPSTVDAAMPGAMASRPEPNRMMMAADAFDTRADMAAYAPSLFGAVPTGEGQAFNFDTSPLVPTTPAAGPNAPMAGTDPRGLPTIIGEMLSGEDPKATADRLMANGQIDQDQYNRYVFGSSGERNRIIREALGREEPRTPAVTPAPAVPGDAATGDPTADTAPPEVLTPDETTLRPQARPDTSEVATPDATTKTPGGGGIAAAARGAAAPSDFEQELMTMLAAREKRAEQDKWLALAQAGMQLMSSTQPTFGGALGEAGAAGLGALREGQAGSEADRLALLGQIEQSRMGREKMDLERQALAARSAADGRPTAIPAAALSALGDQITAISERLSDAMNPVTADQRTTLTNQLESLQQQQTALNAMYFGQYGVAAPQPTTTTPGIIDVRN